MKVFLLKINHILLINYVHKVAIKKGSLEEGIFGEYFS